MSFPLTISKILEFNLDRFLVCVFWNVPNNQLKANVFACINPISMKTYTFISSLNSYQVF